MYPLLDRVLLALPAVPRGPAVSAPRLKLSAHGSLLLPSDALPYRHADADWAAQADALARTNASEPQFARHDPNSRAPLLRAPPPSSHARGRTRHQQHRRAGAAGATTPIEASAMLPGRDRDLYTVTNR